MIRHRLFLSLLAASLFAGCGAPAAGQDCASTDDCPDEQVCLTNFKGGYCGDEDCASDDDCPDGTMCVEQDGDTYCFLMCEDKPECNTNRSADTEANCSANITPVDDNDSRACVPPSN